MTTLISFRAISIFSYLNPVTCIRNLWRHRDLIRQFTRREIEGRYRGSFLGLFWSIVTPLFTLLIYTFVFGLVLKARWQNAHAESLGQYALIIFSGLMTFNFFSESVNRATGLVIHVPNYVKKVVFPLEILPVVTLGASLFHLIISVVILIVAQLLMLGSVPWTLILLPVILLPLMFLSLGIVWFLASLGVFIRDMAPTVALILQALFFFTPIFYSIEAIPEPFRTIILYNPMAPIVENFRRVVLWGTMPSWPGLVMWTIFTGIIMMLGYAWFMKTKKAFADVI